jgi:hypothetical protein
MRMETYVRVNLKIINKLLFSSTSIASTTFQLTFSENHSTADMSSSMCTEVTPECPVEATIYGYAPSLASNTVLLVIFSLCFLLQLALYLPKDNRTFTIVVSFGCLLEAVGYGARLMMNNNPWNDAGFKIQLVLLILAPSFLAAGLYLTLKRLVQYFGPENSRLPPGLYTWIFIGCDALSIVIQAVGGGIAASATGGLLDTGNSLMIAGIAVQVATMFLCALLAVDFTFKAIKTSNPRNIKGDDCIHRPSGRLLNLYLLSVATAFVTVFIRCVYRYVPNALLVSLGSHTLTLKGCQRWLVDGGIP